jgi:glycosyltransferase involved in cell wall biosynthesis
MDNKNQILISVMIPVYNEEELIDKVVEEVKKLDINKEILIVDDGSEDKTAQIASRLQGVKYIRHSKNMGRGAAIITAIKNSSGEILCSQDADMEQSPSDIPRLVQPILEGKALVVYGSRFKDNGPDSKSTWLRMFGNRVFVFLANIIFGQKLTDVYTGSKCYSKKIFEKIKLESKGFEQETEILAKLSKHKIRIYEVPINYKFRTIGTSKVKFKDGIIGMCTMVKYLFKT